MTLDEAIDEAAQSLEPDEDDLVCVDEFPLASAEVKAKAVQLANRILGSIPGAANHVPRFGVAGDGGVALHWKNLTGELFLTIPHDGSAIHFFARSTRTKPTDSILRGSSPYDGPVEYLSLWLTAYLLEESAEVQPGRLDS